MLLLLPFAPPSVVERHSPDLCGLFLISVLYSFVSRLFKSGIAGNQPAGRCSISGLEKGNDEDDESQGRRGQKLKLKAENEKDEDPEYLVEEHDINDDDHDDHRLPFCIDGSVAIKKGACFRQLWVNPILYPCP